MCCLMSVINCLQTAIRVQAGALERLKDLDNTWQQYKIELQILRNNKPTLQAMHQNTGKLECNEIRSRAQ